MHSDGDVGVANNSLSEVVFLSVYETKELINGHCVINISTWQNKKLATL